jgi:hypothetical protein
MIGTTRQRHQFVQEQIQEARHHQVRWVFRSRLALERRPARVSEPRSSPQCCVGKSHYNNVSFQTEASTCVFNRQFIGVGVFGT